MEIEQTIQKIEAELKRDLQGVKEARDVELLRIKYLGKKGLLSSLMEELKGSLPKISLSLAVRSMY